LKELGGALEIESNLDGTLLRATIPACAIDGFKAADGDAFMDTGATVLRCRSTNRSRAGLQEDIAFTI
jgi:hypothetical protein